MTKTTMATQATAFSPHPKRIRTNITYIYGDRIEISQSRQAVIKFIGKTQFGTGTWYGIEFIDGSVGLHNGTYKGIQYFDGASKRCEFIKSGEIRRKVTAGSTRNLRSSSTAIRPINKPLFTSKTQNNIHSAHSGINSKTSLKLKAIIGGSTKNILNNNNMNHKYSNTPAKHHYQQQPSIEQLIKASSSSTSKSSVSSSSSGFTKSLNIITLKIRCQCFADPIPLEIRVNINIQTMKHLKKQIINQCNINTHSLLLRNIINNKSYSSTVTIYKLKMNDLSNLHNSSIHHRTNNVNVKPGNMTHCILKKNNKNFEKVSIIDKKNEFNYVDDNTPLKYYNLINNQTLFALFNLSLNIKIIFQTRLFIKKQSKFDDNYGQDDDDDIDDGDSDDEKLSLAGSDASTYNDDIDNDDVDDDNDDNDNKMKMKSIITDNKEYVHSVVFSIGIGDKFSKLYMVLQDCINLPSLNSIKLLSSNFIYNKSMMIEQFVYNELMNDNNNSDEYLYLYFIHLTNYADNNNNNNNNNNNKHRIVRSKTISHHLGRSLSRNYSLLPGNIHQYSSVLKSNYSSASNNNKASTLYNKKDSNHNNNNKFKVFIKILLNFVNDNKSESFTIDNINISIKKLREIICSKYIAYKCDFIKWNNKMLDDHKLVREYNINTNDILHIYSESIILIHISQSILSGIDSSKKIQTFDIKINKKLTIKHVKFRISKILKYPIISQTLIMKEILNDLHVIDACGIRNNDTLRLVYNFGRRVKKLQNNKLKIPIITFNSNQKFDLIVNKNIYIYQIKQIISKQKHIDINKQQLLFHGIILDKDKQLNDYNITHEIHLFISK